MGYLLNLQIKMANINLTFNETKYDFVLNKVMNVLTANDREHQLRERYTIYINGQPDERLLLVTYIDDKPQACYEILQPAYTNDTDGEYRYNTPYKQYYEKDFPMGIVFSIVTFLNK
jgi:hypothetical protein